MDISNLHPWAFQLEQDASGATSEAKDWNARMNMPFCQLDKTDSAVFSCYTFCYTETVMYDISRYTTPANLVFKTESSILAISFSDPASTLPPKLDPPARILC